MRLPPCSQVSTRASLGTLPESDVPPSGSVRSDIITTFSPVQIGQPTEDLPHAFAPLPAEGGEIRIALVEAATHTQLETVRLIAEQIDGHADGQVAAHGRIEGHEDTFRSVVERGRTGDDQIEDRLPVLGFAGLEKGRLQARL